MAAHFFEAVLFIVTACPRHPHRGRFI